MPKGLKQVNKYFIYDILGTVIYGLILYFGFTWLSRLSLVYGYLWNFALVILTTLFDRYSIKNMQSDKMVMMMIEKYGIEKTKRMMTGGFITFKTLLYFFYIFILIASQVIKFNPTLISENLVNFILANDYSILFLLAFDTLIVQFSKDKERNNYILEKLNKYSSENQD